MRLIGIIILVILLFFIDFGKLADNLINTNLLYLVYSSLLLIPLYIFKSLRWQMLLRLVNIKYVYKETFLAFLASNFLAFITPGRIGEIAKSFYIKNDKIDN